MKKLITKTKLNNKGMTMTEVIIGFVVLMVILGGLSGVIAFSSNMLIESTDIAKAQQVLEAEVFKTNSSARHDYPDTIVLKRGDKTIELDHIGAYSIASEDIANCDLDVKIFGFREKP